MRIDYLSTYNQYVVEHTLLLSDAWVEAIEKVSAALEANKEKSSSLEKSSSKVCQYTKSLLLYYHFFLYSTSAFSTLLGCSGGF